MLDEGAWGQGRHIIWHRACRFFYYYKIELALWRRVFDRRGNRLHMLLILRNGYVLARPMRRFANMGSDIASGQNALFSRHRKSALMRSHDAGNRFGRKRGDCHLHDWDQESCTMINSAQKRGEIIKHLEAALALADELEDGATGYLIERALDEARSRQFRPAAD